MTTTNEKINEYIEQGSIDKIASSGLVPIRRPVVDLWHGKITHYETVFVDTSEVYKEYFTDLSGDAQDFVMQLNCYKSMDYDSMVDHYDAIVEKKNLENPNSIESILKNREDNNV